MSMGLQFTETIRVKSIRSEHVDIDEFIPSRQCLSQAAWVTKYTSANRRGLKPKLGRNRIFDSGQRTEVGRHVANIIMVLEYFSTQYVRSELLTSDTKIFHDMGGVIFLDWGTSSLAMTRGVVQTKLPQQAYSGKQKVVSMSR